MRKVVEVNAEDRWGMTAFHWASLGGTGEGLEVLKRLVSAGVYIHAVDKKKQTILHLLSKSYVSTVEQMEYLVSLGIDVRAEDYKGQTALDIAKNEEVRDYLASQKNFSAGTGCFFSNTFSEDR